MLTHKIYHIDVLLITLLSFFCICYALSPPGSIQLSQQLLLSSLDSTSAASQPFLTSPSGTYAANLVRTQTNSGDSFCSIQVQGKGGGGASASNIIGCGLIIGSHVCGLVFSTTGLGIFDGMNPTWSTSIPTGGHAKDLVLLDSGDMEIVDSNGKIVWKASESRIVADRNCESGFSGIPSEESLGQAPPSEQQNSEMGDFEQKQPQGRHSGFLGFDDQQGYTDEDDDDALENGVSGKGLEIIGVVIVTTFIYLFIAVS